MTQAPLAHLSTLGSRLRSHWRWLAGRWPVVVSQLRQTFTDVYALARQIDPPSREAAAPSVPTALAEARRLAEAWRARAEAADARAAGLEGRLAAAEMLAMELRSRVVCLHGKLATSAATARYQTLRLSLEHETPNSGAAVHPPL